MIAFLFSVAVEVLSITTHPAHFVTNDRRQRIVENDLVIALLSFDDYLNTRREIAHYSTYLFENLLAKQKRMLIKPYPLKQEEQDNG